jgi:hypothetical protein
MASPLERHDFLSRLVFVFQTIGSSFLKASHLTTIVKRFVFKEDECIVGKMYFPSEVQHEHACDLC